MKIAIVAPTHKSFICPFLSKEDWPNLPEGYFGAPFLGDIINELLKNGNEVIAITTTLSDNIDFSVKTFKHNRFTWIVVPKRRHALSFNRFRLGRILDFYSLERRLIQKQLKFYKPDIVHAHWGYEFAHCAINSGFPFLVTIHDNPIVIANFHKSIYRILRMIYATFLIKKMPYRSTVSPYMMPYVSKYKGECKLIPNPVYINNTKYEINALVNKRMQNLDATPRIIMVMNGWDKRKNGKNGLMAFRILQNLFPNAELHLFGSGTESGGAASLDANVLNLKQVFFHGKVERSFLLSQLGEMHILLHTALEESFGVVLIEAMSLGIPAIGGAHSGAVPWVINESRLLSDVNSPENIAETIINCMKYYPEFASIVFENVSLRFSAKTIANQYESYYKYILSDNNK